MIDKEKNKRLRDLKKRYNEHIKNNTITHYVDGADLIIVSTRNNERQRTTEITVNGLHVENNFKLGQKVEIEINKNKTKKSWIINLFDNKIIICPWLGKSQHKKDGHIKAILSELTKVGNGMPPDFSEQDSIDLLQESINRNYKK